MMRIVDNFSSVGDSQFVYKQKRTPLFQNKIYDSKEDALNARSGSVELVQSNISGFVFNASFDPSMMNYDACYQNEQSNSSIFKEHLNHVLAILKSFGIANKKIVEIGAGKGFFFDKMVNEGLDCVGFDPTYEGDNPLIKKEYFNEETGKGIDAEVIVLRHTLEHIANPFSFIHQIARANQYRGNIFIEVPTFKWIQKKNAFWDIFYEHCNYFTEESAATMFNKSITGSFFSGQYMYVWAELSELRFTIPQQIFMTAIGQEFTSLEEKYQKLMKDAQSVAIWGAGAKGSTFLNLIDPDAKFVKYVIDINPAKQFKYIGCTGHKIYPPSFLEKHPVERILIMNENYINEIKKITEGGNYIFSSL